MELEQLLNSVPEYAKDLKLNMGGVLRQTELTEQQAWGTAVACAIAARNPQLRESVLGEAAKHLNEQALFAAKAAASVMGMNNIFYRFRHLSTNPKYGAMPARLRMQVIAKHGSDPIDFELWCLAVSAMNGCGVCVDSHENVLREKGVSEEAVLAAIRIASTIHGLAAILDVEADPIA
uniref:Alkyl hydroperoxide reductase AhpD n=1 Tax=Solibacter usitatus (strain Ellin6076) TaxID=234267 RepID=AHPD_SOLUE|nr:RecName: Full=Alkyl hydroperoxide reductase AhpD; AltName: Full=Alkylhydroperoxidase AhpD [Candidatus Solibacter usitatus Ellin6076]